MNSNEINPDVIKKALECCSNEDANCMICPYRCEEMLTGICVIKKSVNALAYIKQLESDLQLVINDYKNVKSLYENEKMRIDRAKSKFISMAQKLKTAKLDAIKEVAEEVEKLKYPNAHELSGFVIYGEDFDNLVKEMESRQNGNV